MSYSELARDWALRQSSPEALRDAVAKRLLDDVAPPLQGGWVDEYPEDLVVALLKDGGLDDTTVKAVVSGWQAALQQVERIVSDPLLSEGERTRLRPSFRRVFAVADLTGHPALRAAVQASLALVVRTDSEIETDPAFLQDVVSAAMAYPPDAYDRGLWERVMDTRPEVAGYAFRILLDLDEVTLTEISNYFERLVLRQFREGWGLDVWFLGEYVRTARGTMQPVIDACWRIARSDPGFWRNIVLESADNPCWPGEELREARRADFEVSKVPVPSQSDIGTTGFRWENDKANTWTPREFPARFKGKPNPYTHAVDNLSRNADDFLHGTGALSTMENGGLELRYKQEELVNVS